MKIKEWTIKIRSTKVQATEEINIEDKEMGMDMKTSTGTIKDKEMNMDMEISTGTIKDKEMNMDMKANTGTIKDGDEMQSEGGRKMEGKQKVNVILVIY